jgi:hypothetical protein
VFSEAAKNQMLDALTVDRVSLHNGDPGAAGTSNEITGGGYARQACSLNAASGGERALASDVAFTATALQAVTHVGFWLNSGTVFKGRAALAGDLAFNAGGQLTLKAGGSTKLVIDDPA